VALTNSAGVLSEFMAESVLGAVLMLNFGFHRYMEQQRQGLWQQNSWTSLAGKTALIVGSRRYRASRCTTCATFWHARTRPAAGQGDLHEVDELITRAQLLPALARAHVLCRHVPLIDKHTPVD